MASTPLDHAAPVPLWQQLLANLRTRIAAGDFDREFPGEMALVDEYGVSRHTVREAMRRLRAEGVVVWGRGRAPRLAGDEPIEQPLGALYSLFASVQAAGLTPRSEVRRLAVEADGVVAARLGLEESTPLLYLERLRWAGDDPLAWDRVWLPAAIGRPLLDVDFRDTSLYEELSRRCGVRLSTGRERIRAAVPSAREREVLDMGRGEALLQIDRRASSHGIPVEWRQTLVRGDRFQLSASFTARAGYRLSFDDVWEISA